MALNKGRAYTVMVILIYLTVNGEIKDSEGFNTNNMYLKLVLYCVFLEIELN